MMAWARRVAGFSILLGIAVSGSYGSTTTLILEEGVDGYSGTSDTSIYQNRVGNSGGGFPYIFAGVTQDASPRRALLRFDLSAIPGTAVVESVELRLGVDQSRPGVLLHSLHRVSAGWGEGSATSPTEPGGLGAPADPGDATWTSAAHGSVLWTTAGGDFASSARSTALVGTLGTTATFSGSLMVQDVQNWIDQPADNHGWILRGDEGGLHNARRFHSSEGLPGLRPRLTIVIDVPPTAAGEWHLYD